jgi:hypothetical protein
MIRFQNTGVDTVFEVTALDSLSQFLDLDSFRPGPSSHPFQYSLSGEGVLAFTFPGIQLPDSTTDKAASQGFVQFSIRPQEDLAPGTVIENQAAIYFDNSSDPFFTNTTFHTIGKAFFKIISHVDEAPPTWGRLGVYPNPASGAVTFALPAHTAEAVFTLFDAMGRAISSGRFSGETFLLEMAEAAPGMYFYSLETREGARYSGKLMKK